MWKRIIAAVTAVASMLSLFFLAGCGPGNALGPEITRLDQIRAKNTVFQQMLRNDYQYQAVRLLQTGDNLEVAYAKCTDRTIDVCDKEMFSMATASAPVIVANEREQIIRLVGPAGPGGSKHYVVRFKNPLHGFSNLDTKDQRAVFALMAKAVTARDNGDPSPDYAPPHNKEKTLTTTTSIETP